MQPSSTVASGIDSKFEAWKQRLLDLSKRNRLLYFRPLKRGDVLITEPGAESLFAALTVQTAKLTFAQSEVSPLQSAFPLGFDSVDANGLVATSPKGCPGDLLTDQNPQDLALSLYNIRLKARSALEERGVHILFVAFDFLRWYETDTSTEAILSPVILVPVELLRKGLADPYSIAPVDEETLVNPTLAYKLKRDFGISLPELSQDGLSMPLEEVRSRFQRAIQDRPRWSLLPQARLSTFSFEKLVMLRDLEDHAQEAKCHPLVLALAGDASSLPHVLVDLPNENDLDDRVPPQATFQVLDADASQREVVEWAKRGLSFVVQGPPGTGKSQTIVNIIGETLAQGRTVLFVSEKIAALEIVKKRLADCGLEEFVLEAHSHKHKKAELIAQLGAVLDQQNPSDDRSYDSKLRRVTELRTHLNNYVRALHKPIAALGCTPFDAQGRLAAVSTAPDVNCAMANVAETTVEQLATKESTLSDLSHHSRLWDEGEAQPWYGAQLGQFGLGVAADVRAHFRGLLLQLAAIRGLCDQLARSLHLTAPTTWSAVAPFRATVELLVSTPFPPKDWFGVTTDIRRRAAEADAAYRDYVKRRGMLLSEFAESVLAMDDLPGLRDRLQRSSRNVLRLFDRQHRQDMGIVRAAALVGGKLSGPHAVAGLSLALGLRETEAQLAAAEPDHRRTFGRLFAGQKTDWQAMGRALDWTEAAEPRLPIDAHRDSALQILCSQPDTILQAKETLSELTLVLDTAVPAWAFLESVFPVGSPRVPGRSLSKAPLEDVERALQNWLEHTDELSEWMSYLNARAEADRVGLGPFLGPASAAHVKAQLLMTAFQKRFYELWIDEASRHDNSLRLFNRDQQTRIVDEFRACDKMQFEFARHRIRALVRARRPQSEWITAQDAEVTILRRETQKRQRHMPIRLLFARIPKLLPALKPCLLMSPLSVSQFLSASSIKFDLVLFDEASQICPEDAVNSLMRGRQAVVAGDDHQLPPTAFFKSLGIDPDEWSEEPASEIMESLLQEWSVTLPSRMLKWHYRSRNESLIAFSNHHIYRGRLITFPSAYPSEAGAGVGFVLVPDAVYDRAASRTNRIEARRVVELVSEHFTKYPGRSLGVVAFSEAQREAIDNEMQRMVRESPQMDALANGKGPEAFFIKNLESVQGDERDTIFFSVGYGKDQAGRMTMNFGPLNGKDGARRLNVAITRARYHVKVISSILPQDITLEHHNEGVQLLRSYMDYALRGGARDALVGMHENSEDGEPESPFEAAVYEVLSERGLMLHRQVGCSGYRIDLAVIDPESPGRYLLGIECDGKTYHSAKTARDRDRLRQDILEGLGWKLIRIWSTDWSVNQQAQVTRVMAAVEESKRAMAASDSAMTRKPPLHPSPSKIETSAIVLETKPPVAGPTLALRPHGVIPYARAKLRQVGSPEQFYDYAEHGTGAGLLVQLVDQEGPIHVQQAYSRVAGCWQLKRVGTSVEATLDHVIQKLVRQKAVVRRGDFLWPAGDAKVRVRYPAQGEDVRQIEDIALEEIAEAAYLCLRDALSMTPDGLAVQTARVLGYERTGDQIRDRIDLAVDLLLQDKRASAEDDRIVFGN